VATILLARHGEADWNREGRWLGQADRPLTERGRQQALALKKTLSGVEIDAAFSSDLVRAYETALIAIGDRPLPVGRVAALRERSFGAWDGLQDEEIPRRFPEAYDAWLQGLTPGATDAERYEALMERVIRGLREIAEAHRNGIVLVVAHSGPLAVVHAAASGIDFLTDRKSIPETPNGSMSIVSVVEDSVTWAEAKLLRLG